jgi:hypothetical protein
VGYSAENSPAIFMRGGESELMSYCWRINFHPPKPTFLHRYLGISMVLCLQRRHMRGAIFDSPEFANSIRVVYETESDRAQGMFTGSCTVATGTSEGAMLLEFCNLNRPNPWRRCADTPAPGRTISVGRVGGGSGAGVTSCRHAAGGYGDVVVKARLQPGHPSLLKLTHASPQFLAPKPKRPLTAGAARPTARRRPA